MKKLINGIFAAIASICLIICSACNLPTGVSENLVISSIKSISEYGVYFGAKSANLTDEKAKIIEESLRVCIQLIEKDSVDDFVDIDEVMEKVPDSLKTYIEEAVTLVNSKYVEVKGKIPSDKVPYVLAIFKGAFDGIESYRNSLTEASVNSGYEVELSAKYKEAKSNTK